MKKFKGKFGIPVEHAPVKEKIEEIADKLQDYIDENKIQFLVFSESNKGEELYIFTKDELNTIKMLSSYVDSEKLRIMYMEEITKLIENKIKQQ